jgi:hypothetical protein
MSVGNVIGSELWGWWPDGDTWRPTPHHRKQRERAKALLADPGRLSTAERNRLADALRRGRFRRAGRLTGSLRANNRYVQDCKIECPECGAINQIPADL